jgi:hypothetical protein
VSGLRFAVLSLNSHNLSSLSLGSTKFLHCHIAMNCHELARRIESLQPGAAVRDVARLCLLLANSIDDVGQLQSDDDLADAWQKVNLRMQANADQHAAMTEELDNLSRSDPKKFTSDQIWILIRAIKVQSQILQMYIGDQTLSV